MLHSHSVLYDVNPSDVACQNLGELKQNAGEIAGRTSFHLKVDATRRQLFPAELFDTKLVFQ